MAEMEDKMRWFVSYKDGPSFEVSADKASEFIDFFKKKYRDDITEAIVEDERKMVSHSFYDKSFGWECSWKCSVIGIILEGKRNEKENKYAIAGDGGIYYVGDLFDKGNGKGNGKQ